ncbi:MAG: hypothetical protein ACR2L2_01995, partial [Acidobacteriota bacterium]
ERATVGPITLLFFARAPPLLASPAALLMAAPSARAGTWIGFAPDFSTRLSFGQLDAGKMGRIVGS